MNLCEIPFISATALDETLTSSGPGRSAIQKYRQEMRRTLDKGKLISMGRAGTVQLTSVPALACVAIATRWNMKVALRLADVYKKAGFSHLKKSKAYSKALLLVGSAMKAQMRDAAAEVPKTTDVVPICWESLNSEQDVVRNVTTMMNETLEKVSRAIEGMKRFPGRLVRFEGKNALITIKSDDHERLQMANSAYLRAAGICRNGSPFMVHEYRWSPDTTMSLYFPAIDLDYDEAAEAELMARLKSLEKPLPEPLPGLLPVDARQTRKRKLPVTPM